MRKKYFQPLLSREFKAEIINLNYVVRYLKANKEVELTPEEKLPVSFSKSRRIYK